MDNQIKLINILKNYIEKKKKLKKDFFIFQDKKIAIYNTNKKIIAYTDNFNANDCFKLKELLNRSYEKTVDIKNSKMGYIIPPRFFCNEKGLWTTIIKKDKEGAYEEYLNISDKWLFVKSKVFSIYHDIYQFEVLSVCPETKKEKIELCSADTLGRWSLCISFLMNQLAVITDEGSKKHLTMYFKNFLIENMDNENIKSKKTSPYMGWNSSLTEFSPYSEKLHLDYTGDTSNYIRNIMKSFKKPKKTNEEKYIENIKYLTQSKDFDFMFSTFFAAPLLKVLGIRSFTINFHAKSKTLKSLACHYGMSVYGNPNKLKSTGEDTTLSNMEKIALYHNLPFYIDEVKNIDEAINIYCIGNESSRHRLNQYGNIQEKKNWRTIVITTSEYSLYQDNSRSGEINRLLCIPVNCSAQLPIHENEIKEFSRNHYMFLENNYSILGKNFINCIIQHESKINQVFTHILQNINNKEKSDEYRYMIATICTSNYIYRKLFLKIDSLDYSIDLGKSILNKTEDTKNLDEFTKMYNCIVSFYQINKDSFINEGTQPKNNKLYGEIKNGEVRFISQPLQHYLSKNGFIWNNYTELVKRKLILYKNSRIQGVQSKGIVLNLNNQQNINDYEGKEREGIENENQ